MAKKIIPNIIPKRKTKLLNKKSLKNRRRINVGVQLRNFYNSQRQNFSPGTKRIVLIDGDNVAAPNNYLNVDNLLTCIQHFKSLYHESYAVVPHIRMKNAYSTNNRHLQQMEKEGTVVVCPGKNLNNSYLKSDPRRLVLDLATEFDCAIISNDSYHDIINEKNEWNNLLRENVIGFRWQNNNLDFYSRNQKSVDDILNRR